jgi:hypothetical protein
MPGDEHYGKKEDAGQTKQVEAEEKHIAPAKIEAGDQQIIIAIKNAQQQNVGDDIPLRGRIG